MKKLLLSAATALLASVAVCAQDLPFIYKISETPLASADELKSGVYVINAKSSIEGTVCNNGGTVKNSPVIGRFGPTYGGKSESEVGDKGRAYTTDKNYLYRFDVQDDGKFTIQSLRDDAYFSCKGMDGNAAFPYSAKNNICPTSGTGDAPINTPAILEIWEDGTNADGFAFHLTNAKFTNGGAKDDYPCLYNNADGADMVLAYWGAPNTGDNGGVRFTLFVAELAEEEDFVDVEVTFPDFGGVAMVETVKCLKDANATPFINEVMESFGGLENVVIKSAGDDESDLIATTDNAAFTVEGDWICDFEPNEVYRVVVDPSVEATSAMRYMIEAQTIRVQLDDKAASVARIVPERLWYFEPVENEPFHFYMRTLYDQSKGVYFPEPYANGTDAQLSENPTKLELVSKADLVQEGVTYPQFFLKIADSDNFYLNDYGGVGNTTGTLKLLQNPSDTDAGSLFRLYPLTANDKAQINFTGDALATNEDFVAAVTAWNEQNVRAALRRIEFYSQKDLIGPDPGQINNPAGNLVEKIAEAQEVAEKLNNDEEVDEQVQIDLTAALDWTKFIVNPIIPGHFYRFENFVSGKYISSTNYNSSNYMDLTTDADRSNTVFYYMEQENGDKMLVSFDNGKVMNKCTGNQLPWTPVLSDHEKAAKGVEFINKDAATFVIHVDGTVDSDNNDDHRHLYGAGSTNTAQNHVDLWSGSDDNRTRWYVHEIDKLPITFYNIINNETDEYGDEGWSSVYAPVALEVPANEHITAYTGKFVQDVNAEKGDLQHILATEIPANEDGKVIIPAGQVALLFYDGQSDVKTDPDFDPALMPQRQNITYAYLPVVYDYKGELTEKGNLTGSYFAFTPQANTEYYTLHASYNNYFRKYSQYEEGYTFVPGFKANIPMSAEGEEYYQVSPFDPNSMVPEVTGTEGTEGLAVVKVSEGVHQVTVTTPSDEYVVYYKHTPAEAAAPANPPRKAPATQGEFSLADKSGNDHTFTAAPGTVEYYAYHEGKNVTGAVRSFEITDNGDVAPTGIKSVLVNMNGKQVIFDLQGRRMAAPAKGISIINGQKTLVK